MRPLRLLLWWRGLEWSLWLLLASVLVAPGIPAPLQLAHTDKLAHAAGFAVLAAYAVLLRERWRALRDSLLMLAAFGALLEGIQVLLPWRQGDWLDLAANWAGILVGSLLALSPWSDALVRLERRMLYISERFKPWR